jgi:very-short-patch-repair endonuclease
MNTKTQFAKELRQNQTKAEKLFWRQVSNRQFQGSKFKRQVPMGNYIVDFVCHDMKVIVELDGGQHVLQEQQDQVRTNELQNQGYQVIRYWNNDVLSNIEGVMQDLAKQIER